MNRQTLLQVFRTVAYRALQVFVCGPAVAVAMVAAMVLVSGHSPIEMYLGATYDWAQAAVRPASVGQVLIRECAEVERGNPVNCARPRTEVVDARVWIVKTSTEIGRIYLLTATATAIFLAVNLGWRRFSGWPSGATSS